ncbi:MAG: 23S rRNA (adenine(2503)-C(2))-methyltransferase RlmN [Nitrospirota bacterium]|nr:MAG: 23S rRNA (adenine(2503)-C(2))-methyltransferase RlmN [Nitrospirota bacterium]
MIDLKSLSEEEIHRSMENEGLPKFRARQLLHWLYERNVSDIESITELSKELRSRLSRSYFISKPKLAREEVSQDGTSKYLFELSDGQDIESVLIPDGDRLTLCVSSQAGCYLKCAFCLTGKAGFRRDLKHYEITDQVLSVNNIIYPKRITNIVLMGMGEPLLNFDNVAKAVDLITKYVKISKRRITLSTAGIAKELNRIGRDMQMVNLAVSLNAPNDVTRSMLMPINRKYPLKDLIKACREFPLPTRRRITFEYIMIKDTNDSVKDAVDVVKLLKGIPSKVNLIPLNPVAGIMLERSSDRTIHEFQKILLKNNVTAIIRKSKGADISAACGQLRGKHPAGIDQPI